MELELNEEKLKASDEILCIPQYFMFEGFKYSLNAIVPYKKRNSYLAYFERQSEKGIVSIIFEFKL